MSVFRSLLLLSNCIHRHLGAFFLLNLILFLLFVSAFLGHRDGEEGDDPPWNLTTDVLDLGDAATGLRELWPGALLFSVFLDARDPRLSRLRAMVLLDHTPPDNLRCAFRGNGADFPRKLMSPAIFYEMCENHGQLWRAYIVSCIFPRKRPAVPFRFRFVLNGKLERGDIQIGHSILPDAVPDVDMSVCVGRPLDSSHSAASLVAFVELSRLLGAQHFVFYAGAALLRSDSRHLLAAVDFYRSLGLASVLPLNRSFEAGQLWGGGELLGVQDCLYRSMGRSRIVLFTGLDELFVPQAPGGPSSLAHLIPDGAAGFCAPAAQFGGEGLAALVEGGERGAGLDTRFGNCAVRPERVFEMGIHHLSKPWGSSVTTAMLNVSQMILYRYSKRFEHGTKSRNEVMNKYARKFKRNYADAMLRLKTYISLSPSADVPANES